MELTKPVPNPTPANTVNDVAPPSPAPQAPAPEKPADLSLHEPTANADDEHSPKHDEQPASPKAKQPTAPKTKSSGVGAAIFAAVLIVLGLGAMFTYAYLRSQNISLF